MAEQHIAGRRAAAVARCRQCCAVHVGLGWEQRTGLGSSVQGRRTVLGLRSPKHSPIPAGMYTPGLAHRN